MRTAGGLARVCAILRADVLERARQYSFLVVMGLTLYAGYMMVPPADAPYLAFSIGGHRPYYSSAWLGTIFGAVAATLLSLIGFFLVRNAVGRDRLTRVGQIIASTPTGRVSYVLGKWLSNLAVLSAILGLLTLIGPLMQLVRAEDTRIDLAAMAAALWFTGLPPVAVGAAIAVAFETTPLLRGSLGSIVFVALWIFALVFPAADVFTAPERVTPLADHAGLARAMASLCAAATAAGIKLDTGATDLFQPVGEHTVQRFAWTGIAWSAQAILERLAWMGVAFAVALAAALPFDRFDPAKWQPGRLPWRRRARPRTMPGARRGRFRQPASAGAAGGSAPPDTDGAGVSPAAAGAGAPVAPVMIHARERADATRLLPLDRSQRGARLPAVVAAELRLMLRGHAWWWYGAAAALVAACLFVPGRLAGVFFTPALWLWPIGIWSAMGSREARQQTGAIVFSAPHPLARQLPATWLAGVLIGLAVAAVAAVRPVAQGDLAHLAGLAVGAVFVPSLALAFGTWTSSNRAFEVFYAILWYLGPLGRALPFNFLGASRRGFEAAVPAYYLVASVGLVGLALIGRQKQLWRRG